MVHRTYYCIFGELEFNPFEKIKKTVCVVKLSKTHHLESGADLPSMGCRRTGGYFSEVKKPLEETHFLMGRKVQKPTAYR